MVLAWVLNAVALAVGALLGARTLIDPKWTARFVRLQADEQGGGFAGFRATFGGMLAASHAVALFMTLRYLDGGDYVIGAAAIGAAAVLGAAWGGACGGRLLAIWRDAADTRFNRIGAGVEALLSLAIAAPWIAWAFS